MKSKKSIVILLVGLTILIGGMYMRNFFTGEEITQEMMIQEEQERMALYLVNHYESVKKVEFTNFEKNVMTGFWNSSAIVNNKYYISLTIRSLAEKSDISITDHISRSSGEELRFKKNITNLTSKDIGIIYFRGKKMTTDRDYNNISNEVCKVNSKKSKDSIEQGDKILDKNFQVLEVEDNPMNGMQAMAVASLVS